MAPQLATPASWGGLSRLLAALRTQDKPLSVQGPVETADSLALYHSDGRRACSYGFRRLSACAARTTCASYSSTSCTTSSSGLPPPTGALAAWPNVNSHGQCPSSVLAPHQRVLGGSTRLTTPREGGRAPQPRSHTATASGAKASRLQSRLFHRFWPAATSVIYVMPSAIFYAAVRLLPHPTSKLLLAGRVHRRSPRTRHPPSAVRRLGTLPVHAPS